MNTDIETRPALPKSDFVAQAKNEGVHQDPFLVTVLWRSRIRPATSGLHLISKLYEDTSIISVEENAADHKGTIVSFYQCNSFCGVRSQFFEKRKRCITKIRISVHFAPVLQK